MFQRVAVLVVGCGAFLAGCGNSAQTEHEEIISNLVEAGFPAGDITVVDEAVYVGGDTRVSLESSREMLQRGEESQEQYRTANIVSKSLVKKVCLVPDAAFSSYDKLSQGLDLAIENYNQLGLCFTLVRGQATDCSATIVMQTTTGIDGETEFPVSGRPGRYARVGTGVTAYSVDMAEHLITHMLGHAFGMRHSDYYNRAISCGGIATNEGSTPSGAILIPGTPAAATPNGSIMNACVPTTTTGELTSTDVTAWRYLYGC